MDTGFAEMVQRDYGLNIPFFDGTLEQAKKFAQDNAKYLVIYLHSPTHSDANTYLHSVIGSDEVIALLSESSILYGASVMEKVGHRLSIDLGACAFPFIAVYFRRTVIMRLHGLHNREVFRKEWATCTEEWDGCLAEEVSILAERELRERSRIAEEIAISEMEQADIAFLESLQREEEEGKRVAAQVEEEQRQLVAQQEREAEMERQKLAEEAAQLKRKMAAKSAAKDRLPPEPPADTATSAVVRISVRCPSGHQYERCFWRTDLVDRLRDFVMSLDEVEADDVGAAAPSLITGFPPQPLKWEVGRTVFGDMGSLCPRAVVLLRKG